MRALVVVAMFAVWSACGGARSSSGTASSPGGSGESGAAANAPPPCIQLPELDGTVTHASSQGTTVRFCVGVEDGHCYAYDLGTKQLQQLAAAPAETKPSARVETTSAELKVCTDGECVSLAPSILSGADRLQATTNEDGSIAVVMLGDALAGKGYAEVWNVAKPRRLAKFRYARGMFRCGRAAMAGNTVFVSAATCNAPGARGALYSTRGRKLANVGGRDFGTFGMAYAPVDAKTWAFLEENGNRLAIQDVNRGKVVKTIDTSPLWTFDGSSNRDAIGNPGESALVALGDGRLAVIAGAPSTGKIGVVDVGAGTIELLTAPLCTPPPAATTPAP